MTDREKAIVMAHTGICMLAGDKFQIFHKYGTISCPHCGCTLASFVVMPFHFCYMCGGQFGEKKITYKEESEGESE